VPVEEISWLHYLPRSVACHVFLCDKYATSLICSTSVDNTPLHAFQRMAWFASKTSY